MAAMKRVEGVELDEKEKMYLLPHFMMLLVGKPGSGKTTLIKHLVMDRQFYREKFDDVFMISPSHSKIGLPLKQDHATSEFSLRWIYENLDKVNTRQQRTLERLVYMKQKGSETLENMGDGDIARALSINRSGVDSNTHAGLILATNSKDIAMHSGLSARGNDDYMQYKMKEGGHTHGIPLSKTKFGQTLRGETVLTQSYVMMQNKFGMNANEVRRRTNKAMVKVGQTKNTNALAGFPKGGYRGQTQGDDFYSEFISRVSNLDRKILTLLSPEDIEKSRTNVLLILDDVISSIKGLEHDVNLAQLFFNRRHLLANGTVSIIVVTQKYTMIPARIRSNSSWVIMYRLNPLDFENVYHDVFTGSLKQWRELLKFVFGNEDENLQEISKQRKGKNFDNLGIWVETDTYFSNFQQIIFSKLPSLTDTPVKDESQQEPVKEPPADSHQQPKAQK